MQVSSGGARTTLAVAATLVVISHFAGCLGAAPETEDTEIPEDHGLVTIWMSRPEGTLENDVQVLNAVPRLIAFIPADDETVRRTNSSGYADVAEGWYATQGGWEPDEWPKSAEKDWLARHDIWYQKAVPAGNYSEVRIEIVDRHIVMHNAQPPLYLGNDQESTGTPRLIFQPDPEVGVFQVTEGKELVLNFQTGLEIRREGYILIR